jgi:hypothetical protein
LQQISYRSQLRGSDGIAPSSLVAALRRDTFPPPLIIYGFAILLQVLAACQRQWTLNYDLTQFPEPPYTAAHFGDKPSTLGISRRSADDGKFCRR